ncbi:murein biosynthesis integral membrane protein MurJ [Aestuariimicrobium kwangyangense]|uniref:murein biosynthesis integral membrane protein MurJ n=1 Tax=Aestuariimicrobium kwangyangense TaxID=396389 RepID=UPI0003B71214|nr:murein biosynthesis integral membrane protein MurJ [Aestuariimicrobium kwangyangense]
MSDPGVEAGARPQRGFELPDAAPEVSGETGAAPLRGAEPAAPEEPSIGRSSALMAAGTLVSRVLGMVRASLLAACVGISLGADAFAIANTLPNYIYILLSAGVLNAVLIPQITKAMKNPDGGRDFVDRLITASLLLVVAAAVVATALTPLLVRATSNLPPEQYRLAVMFGFVCLPQIAFYGLYAVLGQVLNARNQFAAFMWTPVLANVVQIGGLVYFLAVWGRQGSNAAWTWPMVGVLAGTTTLGIVVQGLALIPPLVRGGFRYRPRFGVRGRGFGSASKMLGWTFTALVLAQLGGFVVQWVITTVRGDNGGVPGVIARDNAFLIFMLPHSFVTTSILTALFPRMTRAHQADDLTAQRRLVRQGLELPAVAVLPMSAGMIALALPIFRVLFPRLTPGEAQQEAWILTAMAIGTMAFGVTTLQQRYCFAREEGRKNLWLQALLTTVQVGFAAAAFLVPVGWAVAVTGLGMSVANIVTGLVFVLVARRDLGHLGLAETLRLYVRVGFVSACAGLMCWGVSTALGVLGSGLLVQGLRLAVAGLVFVLAYLALARLFHITEVDDFVRPVLRRLPFIRPSSQES